MGVGHDIRTSDTESTCAQKVVIPGESHPLGTGILTTLFEIIMLVHYVLVVEELKLEQIDAIIKQVEDWFSRDSRNIVVIHCKVDAFLGGDVCREEKVVRE